MLRLRSSELYTRLSRHELVRQFVKYALVGGLNVLLFLALYNGLREIDAPVAAAYTAGFFLTNVMSFVLNKHWSFRDQRAGMYVRQYLRFAFFTLVGFAINFTAFWLLLIPLDRFGRLGENLAALAAIPFSVVWNFASYRLWTFTPGAPRSAASAAGAGSRETSVR